jgi:hypothetical protein
MNNHQHATKLLRCSKPSRWQRPRREIRNPQPQRSPNAIRCNHSSKCTWNPSQSHYDDESKVEMSGRCLLKLTRMLEMPKCIESEPQASQTLFIKPLKRIEPLGRKGSSLRVDRTRRSYWPRPEAWSPPHVPASNVCRSISTVKWLSATAKCWPDAPEPDLTLPHSVRSRARPSQPPSDLTHLWCHLTLRPRSQVKSRSIKRGKITIGRVRSAVTWRALASGQHSSSLRSLVMLTPAYVTLDLTRPLHVRSPFASCVRSRRHTPPPLEQLTGCGARVRSQCLVTQRLSQPVLRHLL